MKALLLLMTLLMRRFLAGLVVALVVTSLVAADDKGWIELTPKDKPLDAWEDPSKDWILADSVGLDADNPRRLAAKPGKGILVNGTKGGTKDLISKEKFIDLEVHVEFLISKGSNSGVKLMGLYEIQIFDSFGVKEPTGADCGGIYPRADEKPYRYLDKGVPPKVNACKQPGEWQTLDIQFQAPRFDNEGKKTSDAKFIRVTLNDKLIHEDVAVQYPTGAAWRLKKEIPSGPLLLQSDHGPVAFRNVCVRPLTVK